MHFMAQNMVCLSECSMLSLRKTCILLLLDVVVYGYSLYPIDGWCWWILICPSWFSAWWICPLLTEMLNFKAFCGTISFCLMYFDTIARCVYIKDCYAFLENWRLCYYAMLLCIPDNVPVSLLYLKLIWQLPLSFD